MANIEQVVVDAADKLMKAVDVYGPKATSLVLETGRIAATQELATGFAFAAVALVALSAAGFCLFKFLNTERYEDDGWAGGIFVCVGIFLVTAIGAFTFLVNILAWVGLTHPEIYLAAKLLKL